MNDGDLDGFPMANADMMYGKEAEKKENKNGRRLVYILWKMQRRSFSASQEGSSSETFLWG